MTGPLLDGADLDCLREAIDGYTVDAVHAALGLTGQAALQRTDLRGVARSLSGDAPVNTLIRLFLLGEQVPLTAARDALHPLPIARGEAAGLLANDDESVRALVDIRPYAQVTADASRPWWLVSDFGSDVRAAPLAADHVLGVGAAALTLAMATPRTQVGRALDIGTGCGVQALHLATHAGSVVGTDISSRALRFAATTAALSGQQWELRRGSLLEPVTGDRFDLVVSNPPFVVSPGNGGFDYRDSGLPGDAACAALVSGLPDVLAPGGVGQMLANWVITAEEQWTERVGGWLAGTGCDAWVWQREVADPAEYVRLWLRDAGETPGTPRWSDQYDAWLDWFSTAGVLAVGMGLITVWRGETAAPVVVLEDVPQPLEQPIGATLPAWHARQRWLAGCPCADLLATIFTPAPGLELARTEVLTTEGWESTTATLRQRSGMRWEVEVDDAISALIAGCDGATPIQTPVALLAASLDRPVGEIVEAIEPVVRDLVGRGFLIPAGLA